jgi:CBS domain-containing protein
MRRTAVCEVMAVDVVTASPEASFAELARLLHGAGVRAVPIVDPAGVLMGVVSEADLMASAARPETTPDRWRARHVRRDQPEAKAGATTAAELMTPFVEAVAPTTTVATAARLMVERHLRWMPVCDAAGRVLGVISRSDVLTVFLRDDASIHSEIVDEVLGADAHDVRVDVRDGVCSLTGELATRADAERLVRATHRVEGVVAVVDQLTRRVDEQLADPGATPPVLKPIEIRSNPREEHVL